MNDILSFAKVITAKLEADEPLMEEPTGKPSYS